MMLRSMFQSRFGRWQALTLAIFVLLLASSTFAVRAYAQTAVPLIFIDSVVKDQTVTISTQNFPAGQTFAVTMGEFGSRGINGYFVTMADSGNGGALRYTFDIPAALQDQRRIAIRLQSRQGYYSFNWFYNNTATVAGNGTVEEPRDNSNKETNPLIIMPATEGYRGIPTFSIVAVDPGATVTIRTNNFPANQMFRMTMGAFGTRGINGTFARDFDSGPGGAMDVVVEIPEAVSNLQTIAIRAQTGHSSPYYSFNYFANVGAMGGEDLGQLPPESTAVYSGIPTIKICQVVQNGNVTFEAQNFPPNYQFNTYIGGVYADTFPSEGPDIFRHTASIPITAQVGSRVSIRTTTRHANPFYSFNWFYNASTVRDHC